MNVCPNCASENIQRAEVAWSMGTKTSSQSALAMAIAPPARKSTPGMTAVAVLGAIVSLLGFLAVAGGAAVGGTAFGIVGLLVICGAIAGKVDADRYNHKELPALIAEWREKWICLKCGEVFGVKRLDGAPTEDQPLPTGLQGPALPFRQSSPRLP